MEGNKSALLLLGGNLGNVAETFAEVRALIEKSGVEIRRASHLYRSEPWGFEAETPFLNGVLSVETILEPEELLRELLDIENRLGRVREREVGYSSRTVDIDILFYESRIVDRPGLRIPHPRLHERRFALVPLAEIAPELIHPEFNRSVSDLLDSCTDNAAVCRI